MGIASLLAIIDGSTGSHATMRMALGIGRAFDAATTLIQFHQPRIPEPALDGANPHGPLGALLDDIRRHADIRRRRFDDFYDTDVIGAGLPTSPQGSGSALHPNGFCVSREIVLGHENREIARRGRLFDLTVISAPTGTRRDGLDTATEAALLETGRPALLVPGRAEQRDCERVIVAWDGSAEAAKSIHAALPFLRRAVAVDVVYVGDDLAIDPADVCRYLRLHKITAAARRVAGFNPVADALIDTARIGQRSMLVMGASGANTPPDCAYGSTVRAVIDAAQTPILVSH